MNGGASVSDSERKSNGDEEGLVENPIRRFCKSLVRRMHWKHSSAPQDDDKAAIGTVHEPINRVAKQGTFVWGSFSAFEDGSIEVERAGIRQRFRNFSELKRKPPVGSRECRHQNGAAGVVANICEFTGRQRLVTRAEGQPKEEESGPSR
jgi:hypothetical protein